MKTRSSKPARERTSYKYNQGRDTYKCSAGRRLYRHHFNAHPVTMTIGHNLECAGVACWPRTAPAPRLGAA